MSEFYDVWKIMTDYGVATDEEISLVCALCGQTIETLERILFTRIGYCNILQFLEEDHNGE